MEGRRGVDLLLLAVATVGVIFLGASTLLGWPPPPPTRCLPEVEYASGTAVCSAGWYEGITTGNKDGKCAPTQTGSSNETLEYKCDDGKGNTATVSCQGNDGLGTCSSTGSGECGKLVQKKP